MTGTPAPGDEPWLVLRAQAGSREHLEQLLEVAHRMLATRLAPMFDERADAEDVLQDVLFTICRRLWTLNDARLFRPWAHRIAMRAAWKAIHRVRRERDRDAVVDPDTLPSADPEHAIDLADRLTHVSPASRIVLALHYLDGMTIEATAAELGVAPGTVKSRLSYGLRQLRATQRPNDER